MGLFTKPSPSETPPKKRRGSWLMGLLVGGAIGSVLSILFAPDAGKQTRKKAADGSKKVWGQIKRVIDELSE
ncbi:MAG TPA: YtxH domain-containing protein [Candidatus Gracilibacteria bacterium]